jgi:hypothetical protein
MEGLQAPILLQKNDPAKNIPNFQAVFMQIVNTPNLSKVTYFDLRWDTGVIVGGLEENAAPLVRRQ